MGRPSRYPDEFRHEAVQMALASNESRAAVARRLGVNETTLRNWVANELAEQERAANPLSVSPSEFEELRRLRREVAELRVEKEILRKGAAYFAQETIRSAASDSSPIIDTPMASSGSVESSRPPTRVLRLARPTGLAAGDRRREGERGDRGDLSALAPHLRRAAGARRADSGRLALRPQAGGPADAGPAAGWRAHPSTLAHRPTRAHRDRR